MYEYGKCFSKSKRHKMFQHHFVGETKNIFFNLGILIAKGEKERGGKKEEMATKKYVYMYKKLDICMKLNIVRIFCSCFFFFENSV